MNYLEKLLYWGTLFLLTTSLSYGGEPTRGSLIQISGIGAVVLFSSLYTVLKTRKTEAVKNRNS